MIHVFQGYVKYQEYKRILILYHRVGVLLEEKPIWMTTDITRYNKYLSSALLQGKHDVEEASIETLCLIKMNYGRMAVITRFIFVAFVSKVIPDS